MAVKNFPITEDDAPISWNPNTNYGANTTLELMYYNTGTDSALLKCALAGAGLKVKSAKLYMYCYYRSVDWPYTEECCPCNSTWAEMTVNWNSKPTYGASMQTRTISTTGWWTWDLTVSLVQQWVDGGSNYGMYINPTYHTGGGGDYPQFYARENAAVEKPYIKIIYTTQGGFVFFLSEAWEKHKEFWAPDKKLILPKDLGFSY